MTKMPALPTATVSGARFIGTWESSWSRTWAAAGGCREQPTGKDRGGETNIIRICGTSVQVIGKLASE